jgi:hypothetical protein
MKNQLENLVALAKIIDMDLFYVVSFRGDQITLQGSISKEAVKTVVDAGYSLVSNKEGWLDYTSVELRIVLT